MTDEREPPYWVLISVLFSSQPMTASLARILYTTAYEMHRRDEGERTLKGEMLQGRLANLRKTALIGEIGGPSFEAQIETERGAGTVRFLLTWQGIEMLSATQPKQQLN